MKVLGMKPKLAARGNGDGDKEMLLGICSIHMSINGLYRVAIAIFHFHRLSISIFILVFCLL